MCASCQSVNGERMDFVTKELTVFSVTLLETFVPTICIDKASQAQE